MHCLNICRLWVLCISTAVVIIGHFLEGVIPTVSLTLGLIRRRETTSSPLGITLPRWCRALSLCIQWYITRGDCLSLSVLINIVDLNVIETIVEIPYIQCEAVLIYFLINLHLVFYVLNPARWNLTLRHLAGGCRTTPRPIGSMLIHT